MTWVDDGEPVRVLSVQHFCLHDGPGTRSLVFFKGCPLRCAWCCNPESWTRQAQLAHKAHLCIGCEQCVHACPNGAMLGPGQWDARSCDLCGACARACPSGALVKFGDTPTVNELMDALRPEYGLYARSGGGVTFSGGEATLAGEFGLELATTLCDEGVHVAIETCGLFNWGPSDRPSAALRLLRATDLVLFDLKLFDDALHRRHCGASNEPILANLRRLAEADGPPKLWPRMPLIPRLTATEPNLRGWAGVLRDLEISRVTLVPYHAFGAGKRNWLRGVPPAPELGALDETTLEHCRDLLARDGIETFLPGEERWFEAEAQNSASPTS